MRVGLGQADGDRGPQVAQLGIEPVQPGGLIGPVKVRRGRLGQGQVVVAVRGPRVVHRRRAQRVQLAGRVPADGFQQPVPARPGTGVAELDQALIHQAAEVPRHLRGGHVWARGDRLGRGQGEPPGEHRELSQDRLLGAGE